MIILESNNQKKNKKYIKKIKCPYCEARLARKDLIYHIDRKHEEMIPQNYTATRIVFNTINHKEHGNCVICGNKTAWDEEKGRYDRLCSNPKCHEEYLKQVRTRMYNKYGTTNLITDKRYAEEQQKKMLANRRISGEYKFQNGDVKTYTGSYEKKCLEFMDKVLNCKSEDIITPGPTIEYTLTGVTHLYISDIYYVPYNLIIEIKDGGNNPNNRNMEEYRAKQIAKEKAIIESGEYNYLRLTDNNFSQLLEIFAELKFQLVEGNKDPVININENLNNNDLLKKRKVFIENMSISSFMPPQGIDDIYVINYGNKITFGNYDKLAVSRYPDLSNSITVDKLGNLVKLPEDYFMTEQCNSYVVHNALDNYKKILEDYLYNNSNHTQAYIYETMTGKKFLSLNQLNTTLEFYVRDIDIARCISENIQISLSNNIYWKTFEKSPIPYYGLYVDENGYFMMNKDNKHRTPSFDTYDEICNDKKYGRALMEEQKICLK